MRMGVYRVGIHYIPLVGKHEREREREREKVCVCAYLLGRVKRFFVESWDRKRMRERVCVWQREKMCDFEWGKPSLWFVTALEHD